MKNRVLIIIISLLGFRAYSQPEPVYPGNLVASGYLNNSFTNGVNGSFPIGFDFTFFSNTYSEFYISENGLVLFGVPVGNYSTVATIPTATAPNNYIAPFWDNLTIETSGRILYTTVGASPNRKLIIQYKNMGFWNPPKVLGSFQVILYETSNKIQIQYRLIVDPDYPPAHGQNATIGIENAGGTEGKLFAFKNSAAISSGQAISFTPNGSTYDINSNALFEWVFLTLNPALPEPGITTLLSPPENSVVGVNPVFKWTEAAYASSYSLKLSLDSNLATVTNYSPGSDTTYNMSGLLPDTTYYWVVFSTNATGETWCEKKKFRTSSTPPLAGIPRTVWVEQGYDKTIYFDYTGGDASAKTAVISSLPTQGQLYQYAGPSTRGALISTFPTNVTDPGMNVIYAASGSVGNGAGNFNFKIHDNTGDSPNSLLTVNVNPPGVPNVLNLARNQNVEIQLDRPMNDPAGKQIQFTVKVNTVSVLINSAGLKPGDPNTIILTLATPLIVSDAVLVSYTKGDVSATTGGLLASFTDIPVTLLAQTITFPAFPPKKYGDVPFFSIPAITTSSGLAVTLLSSNFSIATTSAITITITGVGTLDITAMQAGNSTYAPARYMRTLTVSKGDQTIAFSALPNKTYGDTDYTITATASSGLSTTFASDNPAVATVTGNIVHITGAGTATITASQPGNTLWNPAPDVPRTLTVNKANQTISFSVLLNKTYGDVDFALSATASSSLSVGFSSDNPAVATIISGNIHITGGGTAIITASQPGDGNYNPAPDVPRTLTVNKTNLTFTAENKTKEFQQANPALTFLISGFVNGEGQSVLDALPSIQTTALLNSPVGDYPITISGGNDNSYAFIFVPGTLTVTKLLQTITFTSFPAEKLLSGGTFSLAATSTSGLTVLFQSTDNEIATVSGNLLTAVSKGKARIRAYNSGDANYEPAELFDTVEVHSTHKDIMYLFTPNGDGINDYWELPELAAWGKCDVKLYNRWGKLVFADANYNNLWNGTSNGNPVPEGAYYFVIKTENEGVVKGTVNIVR